MKKALWVLAVVVAGLGAYAANVLATPAVGQSTTTLGKALAADPVNLSGHAKQPGGGWRARLHTHGISDFYVIDNKFEVGGTSGWHSHPGPSLIFVVAGQITNYLGNDPSCTPHVYSAGQSFTDNGRGRRAHAPQQRHGAGRDDRGAVPAEGHRPQDRRAGSAELPLLSP